ncbi:erythromycin esterase family protein [Rhodocytophaga rosea]|uniref:Erythromycin esterase family protein n=1 Tax=Rhodocytophaga rosea TaxID=2704465 RepID=A0A6C0GTW2_9BACT|nr:erythromycin esterase family protein [Rhodocytophaga rosea]QHT71615.1 erythromycin esterase family protein [Rhodocytophaga rosea]
MLYIKRPVKIFFCFISLLITFPLLGQSILNLSFEPHVNGNQPLKLWYTKGPNYVFYIDTTLATEGKGSLVIESKLAQPTAFFTIYTNKLPVDSVKGKLLTLQVLARAEKPIVIQTYIAVQGKVDRLNDVLRMDTLKSFGKWHPYKLQIPVPLEAGQVAFGFRMFGSGKVWFDKATILLDSIPYPDIPIIEPDSSATTASARTPSQIEIDWLQKYNLPLQTFNPAVPLEDLYFIKSIMGTAQIVGLGEVSHGSREIFLMKHRLLRYLVEQHGFSLFAIEADMGAADRLNQYVLAGEGDPRQLLTGLGFWTWNTEEILGLISWMRKYNMKSTTKVKFTGFDMQVPEVAMDNLWQFAEKRDTLLKNSLQPIKEFIKTVRTTNTRAGMMSSQLQSKARLACRLLHERIELQKGYYLNILTLDELSTLRQDLLLLNQFIEFHLLPLKEAAGYRDACMADNLHYLLGKYPKEKVVVWAHNGHVSNQGMYVDVRPMGRYLKDTYKEKYINVGFAFGQGSYRGIDPASGKIATIKAEPAQVGSYEQFFDKVNSSAFMLDLRKISLSKATQWLFEPRYFRTVGAMATRREFSQTQIVKEFDLILFLKESTAAKAL